MEGVGRGDKSNQITHKLRTKKKPLGVKSTDRFVCFPCSEMGCCQVRAYIPAVKKKKKKTHTGDANAAVKTHAPKPLLLCPHANLFIFPSMVGQ